MLVKLLKMLYGHRFFYESVRRLYKSPWLSNRSLYRKWVFSRAFAAQARLESKLPDVVIETILSCNSRCRMCAHGHKKLTGEMSMAFFEKLIADVASLGLKRVSMSLYGEPFLDRHWLERIALLRANGLSYGFSTNASLMTKEVLVPMLEMGGWESVTLSINGLSSEVYENMMPPLKKDTTYANAHMFLELKQRYPDRAPYVTLSCVKTKLTAPETKAYFKYWSKVPGVDRIVFPDCGDWLGECDVQNLSSDHKAKQEKTWLAPCPSLWGSLCVFYDGSVTPCCQAAANRQLIVGDIKNDNLRDILLGPKIEALRQQQLRNRRSEHPICGRCPINPPWLA